MNQPCLVCGGRKPTGVLEICTGCLPVICPRGLPQFALDVITDYIGTIRVARLT